MPAGRLRASAVVIAAVAAMTGSACAPGADPIGDKTGDLPSPIVLRLATPEGPGTPGRDIVDRFVTSLTAGTHGRVRVEVSQTGQHLPSWDQATVRALLARKFDLALVPAGAWHSFGVTTLEPLQLPTLIEEDGQADRVADSIVTAALLSGLDRVGVTGLGLFPEGMRHVALYGTRQTLTLHALDNKLVRAPRTDASWDTIRALGGIPVDVNDFAGPAAPGAVQAVESSLALAGSLPGWPGPTMTANVSLYYRFQVLAERTEVVERLDPVVQRAVWYAAWAALADTLVNRTGEAVGMGKACTSGPNAVVLASRRVQAELRARMRRQVTDAVRDPATADLVSQINDAALQPYYLYRLRSCDNSPTIRPESVVPRGGDLPNGVYRVEMTEPLLRTAGMGEADLPESRGIWTFVLHNGRASWTRMADGPAAGAVRGDALYEVSGHSLTWRWGSERGAYALRLSWSIRAADRALIFSAGGDLPQGDYSPMRLAPMVRIG